MSTETNLTRKERERIARRDEILHAARKVFSERGFAGATLDEIAVAAEFGKGTIYNYFSSKEELFVSVILTGMGRFREFVEAAVEAKSSSRGKIAAFVEASFEFFERHHHLFSILELERYNLARSLNQEMFERFCKQETRLHDFLHQIFKEGIRKREFKKLDSQKLSEALFGLIHVTMIRAIREPDIHGTKEDAEFIKKLFFQGILT